MKYKSVEDYLSFIHNTPDECWHFPNNTKSLHLNGKYVSVTRAIYEKFIGEFPGIRARIDRKCGDRTCINPLHMYHKDVNTRFWEKVDVRSENECWNWTGSVDGGNYGEFMISTHNREKAHRYSWRLVHGDIPDKLYICHHCDNPLCVNPSHLFLGTSYDNTHDKLNKNRHKRLRGKLNGMCKLQEQDIIDIREKHNNGVSYKKLGAEYGISMTQIGRIIKRESWVWL